jgi:hypothetical protein
VTTPNLYSLAHTHTHVFPSHPHTHCTYKFVKGVEIRLFPFSLITSYHANLPDAVVSASHCENMMRERKFYGVDKRLFELCNLQIPSHMVSSFIAGTTTLSPDLWHFRLSHASLSRLQLLASQGHLGSISFHKFDCMSCQFGKQTNLPFNNSDSFSSTPFDLVHSDVWDPAPFTTEGGSRYFVIFVDDYSRFTWIYMLKHRSNLVLIFQTFHKMIQTQFSRTIKVFRSDNT